MALSRREFCSALGAAGLSVLTLPGLGQAAEPRKLRVIAYNIYKGMFWPDMNPAAKELVKQGKYIERLAAELKKYQPDIVNFSESLKEKDIKALAELMEMNHVWFPSAGSWPGTILSKFEILSSQNVPLATERPKDLFTRHWGTATLALPGGQSLIVHSAHLYPVQDPTVRLKEQQAMLEVMKPDLDDGKSMLLIGDLNHTPDSEEYRLWGEAGWIDTFVKAGKGDGLTIQADTPKKRIDYVLAAGPIAQQVSESRALFEGAFRTRPDHEEPFALSDHLPQFAEFKLPQ